MNQLTTHVDTLNGTMIEIVLNAPYQTVVEGSAFARGLHVKRFCQENSSPYCKIVGRQCWASPVKGALLFAFIDQHLEQWQIDQQCLIYVPLDNYIYTVEVGEFISCIPGSESIIDADQAQQSDLPVFVLAGGLLTEHYNDAIDTLEPNSLYKFSGVWFELTRNRFFTYSHYIAACSLALSVVIGGTLAPGLVSINSEPQQEPAMPYIEPQGADMIVSQLETIDAVLKTDIDYFLGKGLTTFTYDTQNGVTLTGAFPQSDNLSKLLDDAADAGLNVRLSGNGWSISKMPDIAVRPAFGLGAFSDTYLILQRLQEQYGLEASLNTPSTSPLRRTMSVQLAQHHPGMPPLLDIARAFTGQAVSVESIEITFNEYQIDHMNLILTIAGKPS